MNAKFTFLPAMVIAAALALAIGSGCNYSACPDGADGKPVLQLGGYHAGFLQPHDIDTVYVETFASQEFRRELEFRLTEAVVKRLLIDTKYRIAPRAKADTILTAEVRPLPVTNLGHDFDKDLPKEVQIVMVLDWTWKNRRTGEIIAQHRGMQQAAEYLPLANETFFDGSEEGINDLAKRVVEGMEADW